MISVPNPGSAEPTAPTAPAAPAVAILAEITAGLAAGRDLHDLLQRILDPVVRLSGARGGAVRVLREADQKLHLVSRSGSAAHPCRAPEAADRHCGPCGEAADAPGVVWAADPAACRAATPAAAANGQRLLVVPLQHRGRVLGVYNLFFDACTVPSADVLALLKSVGELLGLALDNLRLEGENLRATLLHERQMMAADVHDTLAQSLTFVKMRLPLLHDAMLAHDDARSLRYWGEVRGEVSRAHASLRAILTHLRMPMDPQGLEHALAVGADNFRRACGTELDVVNELPGLKLDAEQETQVFHIVQEALSNIARHAHAGHARLRIAAAPAGSVEVLVEDDGSGLPQGQAPGGLHYGMDVMLERARRIGGTLEVLPRPGGGTRVRLAFALAGPGGH